MGTQKNSFNEKVGHQIHMLNLMGKRIYNFTLKNFIYLNLCYWSRGQTDIYGLFCEFVAPPGRKSLLLFSVRDMSWGLGNQCFTKFSVVSFL